MTTNNQVDVSVILVTYNTKQMTSECIDSIISHTQGVTYEIILVDNHSTDGSKEFFTNDKRVKYVYSDVNGGFGFGNNLGIHYAYGKYIFLLNTDTLLINNAIKEFFDYAESHGPNTVYGCWLVNGKGEDVCSYYNFPALSFVDFWNKHIMGKDVQVFDHKEKLVDAICGADMFIPRSVVEAIGGFDTNIFMYGEEGEFQYRMKKAGFNRMLIPQPRIIHLEGKSNSTGHKVIDMRGHFVFLKKYMPRWKYILARLYYVIIYTIALSGHLQEKWARKSLRLIFSTITLKDNATKVELPIL